MKIGKRIGFIIIGYFAIGGLIALTQLGLSKLFEPPCNGIPLHTLWTDFRGRDMLDDLERLQATAEGKQGDESLVFYVFRFGRGLARWLPDLYREVIVGDMTVQNYLLGGFQCYTGFPLPHGFAPEAAPESGNKPEDSDISKHDIWQEGDSKGARKP